MNSERQAAYLNLINQLLTCPNGEEAEILKTHPDLLDDGLVAAMLEEADNLNDKGELDNANWLMDCAWRLAAMNKNFSVVFITQRKAEANRLNAQGIQHCEIGQVPEALQSWEQALTIYQEIRDRQGEANSLGNLGLAYDYQGQHQLAIEFHKQSLEIKREIGDRKGEAASVGNLGLAYYSIGQYHKAIKFHQQSCKVSREIGYRQQEANSLGNLGLAYDVLGQHQRAIKCHQQSFKISREIGNRQEEANSLDYLGVTYRNLGQEYKAIKYHQQSCKVSREIGYPRREANSLINLGIAYRNLKQYHKAIKCYRQSLKISREIGYRQGESWSISGLGITYDFLGQYQRAIKCHQQSVKISREIDDHIGEGIALNCLGIAYQSLGQHQRAIKCHQESLNISREIESRGLEASSLHNLGVTFLKNNQFAEAEAKFRDSIKIHETLCSELIKDNHKISIFETQAHTYRNLQQVLVAQTKFEEALEISELGRTRAFAELLQQNLLTTNLATNEITNTLSIARIQQIAQQKNSTIVEYSIVVEDIYIWVIQPNGNITHRAANLEPLKQQNQSLKQIILKARVSIGVDEIDEEKQKIKIESEYNRDDTGGYPLLKILYQILIEPIADLLPTDPRANASKIYISRIWYIGE